MTLNFGWISQELELLEETFKDYLNSGYNLVTSKTQELERKRISDLEKMNECYDYSWESYIYEKVGYL